MTHTTTFLDTHRYDEDASCNVTARLCPCARHVSILRYPRAACHAYQSQRRGHRF